jgi:hypothetical protein
MPPLFLLSLASHTVYFWFPVLMLFLIGIFQLAETIPSTLPDLSEATLLHVR